MSTKRLGRSLSAYLSLAATKPAGTTFIILMADDGGRPRRARSVEAGEEQRGRRHRKEFLVVEMRVSVSQANPTIAQTLTMRRAVVYELCLGQVHLTRSTKGEEAAALLGEDFAKGPLSHDGLWYNDDNNFRDAITHALKMAEERREAKK